MFGITVGARRCTRDLFPAEEPAVSWQRRRELERRLNDEAAVRLGTLSLQLGLLAADLDDRAAVDRLTRLQDDVRVILEELREIGSDLYPPVLVSSGVGPALLAYAERRRLPVSVSAPPQRHPCEVEAALYFAVIDLLDPPAAAGLNGSDQRVTVALRRVDDDLVATLTGGRRGEVRIPVTMGGC